MKKLPLLLLSVAAMAIASQAQARCMVNFFGRYIIFDPGACGSRTQCVDLPAMFEVGSTSPTDGFVLLQGTRYPLASDSAARAFKAKFPDMARLPASQDGVEREFASQFARKGATTLPRGPGVIRRGEPTTGVWDGGCDGGGCTPHKALIPPKAGPKAPLVGSAPLRPAEF